MPSNHVSNEPYHEWLKEQSKKRSKDRVAGIRAKPKPNGGWTLTLDVKGDDDLPVILRGLTDWLNAYADRG